MSFRSAGTVVALLGLNTGCFLEIFDPCPKTKGVTRDMREIQASGTLDGTWNLITVNGRPVPFSLPLGAAGINSADITFRTTKADYGEGGCTDVVRTRGIATATYNVHALGETTFDFQIGNFVRHHKENSTELRALGQTQRVQIGSNVTLTATRPITDLIRKSSFPIPPQFNTVTLVFRKEGEPIGSRVR